MLAAACEAFGDAYPESEIPNKATVHRPVTKFRDTRTACDKRTSSDKTVATTAVPISSSASAVIILVLL
jgi:hypothetical protein